MKHASMAELALYAGRDCGLVQQWRMRHHLRRCSSCRSELRAQESARQALRDHVAEMPAGINWDRLAEEMRGNIRVGLAAGECVGDFPAKRRGVVLHWNIGTSMGMLVLLFVAAFVINLPPPQAQHLVGSLRRIVGMDRPVSTAAVMSAVPAAGVVEASPQLIEMRSNGTSLSVVAENASDVRVSVNLQGSAAARSVDADTGEVTISRVYDAQ